MAEKKALQDIDAILQMHGMKCSDFSLPEPGPIQNVDQVFDISSVFK